MMRTNKKSNSRVPTQVDEEFKKRIDDLKFQLQLKQHKSVNFPDVTNMIIKAKAFKDIEDELLNPDQDVFKMTIDKRKLI